MKFKNRIKRRYYSKKFTNNKYYYFSVTLKDMTRICTVIKPRRYSTTINRNVHTTLTHWLR